MFYLDCICGDFVRVSPIMAKKQLAWIQVYQRYFCWPINSAIVFAIIKLCYIMFCGLGHTRKSAENILQPCWLTHQNIYWCALGVGKVRFTRIEHAGDVVFFCFRQAKTIASSRLTVRKKDLVVEFLWCMHRTWNASHHLPTIRSNFWWQTVKTFTTYLQLKIL